MVEDNFAHQTQLRKLFLFSDYFKYSLFPKLAFNKNIFLIYSISSLQALCYQVGVNPDLYYIVLGESLLNDAVAVVLYNMMIAFAGKKTTLCIQCPHQCMKGHPTKGKLVLQLLPSLVQP